MTESRTAPADAAWLLRLYTTRAVFSLVWVAFAFALGRGSMPVASVLLVVYPAWDALANLADARRSGGLGANPTQAINAAVSVATAVAMAVAVGRGMPAVFVVFGTWAVVAGLMQLGTAIRRWKRLGAQWPMALSGAQSALAGTLFVTQSGGPGATLEHLAGYATVGAVYFLVSAAVLVWRRARGTRVGGLATGPVDARHRG